MQTASCFSGSRPRSESHVNERRTTGQALPGAFGLEDAPMLTTRLLNKSAMAVTEIRGQPNFGVTKALPYDDAYFISLHLLASPDHDQFFNGRDVKPENFVAGITSIYDLRCNPIAYPRDPFYFFSFYLHLKAPDPLTHSTPRTPPTRPPLTT